MQEGDLGSHELISQYRTLLETSIDGFFINVEGHFHYVNPAFQRLAAAVPAGTRLEERLDPGHYPVLTDTTQMHQVLLNLCTNSWQAFAGQPGRITTKRPGLGTGLGLSVVHGIAKSHGARLTCTSRVGFGTTFRLYLPLVEHVPASAPDSTNRARWL